MYLDSAGILLNFSPEFIYTKKIQALEDSTFL